MFNHRISPLFSIAVLGLSLAAAGGGTYAIIDSLPKVPHKEIRQEPKFTPPPVEVAPPTPEPVRVEVETSEPVKVPVIHIAPRTHKSPIMTAKVERPAQPCEMVCEDNWNDSVLFVGGRYKNCKCK